MAPDEDRCRVRMGHAAENFSRLRRLAPNPLRAGRDHDFLLGVPTG